MSMTVGTVPGMLGRVEAISLFGNDVPTWPDQLNIHMHRLHELMRLRRPAT